MHTLLINIISAITIGIVIGVMASIKNKKLRSTIYSLPIPITVGLIVTRGRVDATNVLGLLLLSSFLWFVYYLHNKLTLAILTSDVISAIGYIVVGYTLTSTVKNIGMLGTTLTYLLFWTVTVIMLRKIKLQEENSTDSDSTKPITKSFVTSVLSYGLFSAKTLLQGVVVTFPYSGVFAVVEAKSHLATLSSTFTRNSVAILGMFITIYNVQAKFSVVPRLAIGWLTYLIILALLEKSKVLD